MSPGTVSPTCMGRPISVGSYLFISNLGKYSGLKYLKKSLLILPWVCYIGFLLWSIWILHGSFMFLWFYVFWLFHSWSFLGFVSSFSTSSYSQAGFELSPDWLISLEAADIRKKKKTVRAGLLTPTTDNWGWPLLGCQNDSNRRGVESHLEWRLHDSSSRKTQPPSLRITSLSPA